MAEIEKIPTANPTRHLATSELTLDVAGHERQGRGESAQGEEAADRQEEEGGREERGPLPGRPGAVDARPVGCRHRLMVRGDRAPERSRGPSGTRWCA